MIWEQCIMMFSWEPQTSIIKNQKCWQGWLSQKLALPFYYHNTETDERKIQLLAPLYFPGAPVRLALVLNKIKSENNEYYEGVTVLPVEWAYMNSRLIVKPDEEWAKIIDEIDSVNDADSIQDAIDITELS